MKPLGGEVPLIRLTLAVAVPAEFVAEIVTG
jgi:hypothetical protein